MLLHNLFDPWNYLSYNWNFLLIVVFDFSALGKLEEERLQKFYTNLGAQEEVKLRYIYSSSFLKVKKNM